MKITLYVLFLFVTCSLASAQSIELNPSSSGMLKSTRNDSLKYVIYPDGGLMVNGFTQLGIKSPKIKVQKVSGTMPSTEGGCIVVPVFEIFGKILDYSVIVDLGQAMIKENHTRLNGFQFQTDIYRGELYICNQAGNSLSLINRPFGVTFIHEE